MNSEQQYELQMTLNELQAIDAELDSITLALMVNTHLNLVNEEGEKSGDVWYALSGDMLALHDRQAELMERKEALDARF